MENTNRFGSYKPEDFIIEILDVNGNVAKYMTNQGRIIAFRNEYPNGKIRCEEKYYPELSLFVVTAYIYADKNDPIDSYLACDFGSRVFQSNNSLPEAATQAISRALGRCGFGTTYSSPDEGFDGSVAEAGLIPKDLVAGALPKQPAEKEAEPTSVEADGKVDAASGAAETTTVAEPVKKKRGRPRKTAPETTVEEAVAEKAEEEPEEKSADAPATETTKVEEPATEATPVSPAAEKAPAPTEEKESRNFDSMTLEEAKKVQIPFGQKKGQYMGEVYATDPNAVRWYAEKYAGDNQEVKKAAQVILAAFAK